MTALLNRLIRGYDKRLRPNFGGKLSCFSGLRGHFAKVAL